MDLKTDSWPDCEFRINSFVKQNFMGGWRWYLYLHIDGPGDVLKTKSEKFEYKGECIANMHQNLTAKIEKLLREYE